MTTISLSNGLILTAESPQAAAIVDAFEQHLLGLTPELDTIPAAAALYPETAMVQACAATYFLYGQDAASFAQADTFLNRAEALVQEHGTEREARFIRALRLIYGGLFLDALELLEEQTRHFPRDLLAAKVAEFLYYFLGQQYNGHRFRSHMERLEKGNSGSAGYWSMRSFATELCGDFHLAQEEAERSLAIDPRQPWAHHTLAHILSRQGNAAQGIAEMEARLPIWRQCNRGIHSHNAWHLGLLYLDDLEFARIDKLIDSDLWGIAPDTVFEQLDTIALLWRLDLVGKARDDLWPEVAEKVVPHSGECLTPFIEGHYAYALARGGQPEAAERATRHAAARAELDDALGREVWAAVGAPFVQACAEFGAGQTAVGANRLEPLLHELPKVGGSDAQDDLFRQATIAGLRDAGRTQDAHAVYDRSYGHKWRTAYDDKLLAKVL